MSESKEDEQKSSEEKRSRFDSVRMNVPDSRTASFLSQSLLAPAHQKDPSASDPVENEKDFVPDFKFRSNSKEVRDEATKVADKNAPVESETKNE